MREPPYREPPIDDDGSGALPSLRVHKETALEVSRVDRVDAGERDDAGFYDYKYQYAVYDLALANGETYGARRHADEWTRVAIFLPPGKRSSIP